MSELCRLRRSETIWSLWRRGAEEAALLTQGNDDKPKSAGKSPCEAAYVRSLLTSEKSFFQKERKHED